MSDLPAAANQAFTDLHRELRGLKPTNKITDPFAPVVVPQVPNRKGGISPVTSYVRSLPGGPYLTALEVAKELNCSVQAIRKYAKNKVTQAPSYEAPFGKLVIYLYTKDDVQALRDYISGRRQVFPSGESRPEPEALRKSRD